MQLSLADAPRQSATQSHDDRGIDNVQDREAGHGGNGAGWPATSVCPASIFKLTETLTELPVPDLSLKTLLDRRVELHFRDKVLRGFHWRTRNIAAFSALCRNGPE